MNKRHLAPAFVLGALLTACASQPSGVSPIAQAPTTTPSQAAPATPVATNSALLAAQAVTAINPHLAGARMLGNRTIAANVAAAPNLRALSRALGASDAGRSLAAAGPVTVFAPNDEAFGRMSPGAVDQLLQPASRDTLNRLVNYHVVRGSITLADLRAQIDRSGGVAHLSTVDGAELLARQDGGAIALTDTLGNTSYIETPDVQQANGVFHVINGVMIPRLA